MFIIDSIESESAWQDLLSHTELPSVVEVEEDVGDVGDNVEDDGDELEENISFELGLKAQPVEQLRKCWIVDKSLR